MPIEKTRELQAKNLGLVIVDGVGYRNFILGDFLSQGLAVFDRLVIFSALPANCFNFKDNPNIDVVELPVFYEARETWFWRKAKEMAHMQLHKSSFPGISFNLKKNLPALGTKRGFASQFIFSLTSILHSEFWINFFYHKQMNSLKSAPEVEIYTEILRNNPCRLLFFTQQRPSYLAPLLHSARALEIETCSFIFSWDNLSSKARMAAAFHSFLVWSSLMKNELNYFYPETKNQTVEIVGTPQFESHLLQEKESARPFFHQRFGLDPFLKTICYSCGDASTSKNDAFYIQTLAEFIKQDKITEKVNLLVRTSPAEDGQRFKQIAEKFPFVIWNYPRWSLTRDAHPEPWTQRLPHKKDLEDLRLILQQSDLNINMCSTMSLDFMICQKPVVNAVFGTVDNGLYNDQKYLQYSHYERVVKSGAVAVARNEEELLKEINYSLKNPLGRIKEQEKLLKLMVEMPLVGTSKRIAAALRKIAERKIPKNKEMEADHHKIL